MEFCSGAFWGLFRVLFRVLFRILFRGLYRVLLGQFGEVVENDGWRFLFLAHLEEEGEGVVSQLSEQFLLDLGVSQLLFVLQLGVNLPGHQEQVPPEGHAHHIHVLTAVPKCARQHHVH